MSTEQLILVEQYCQHEDLEISFVLALCERGLLPLEVREGRTFIASEQVARLERMARLHFDLDINLEGIEAISHMLDRMDLMQGKLHALHERLRLYEP